MERERITEEEYLIGEANGISRKNVYQRWYHYGWEIERAITEPVPVKEVREWASWKEIALANGVYHSLFNARIKKGLTPEQAATMPIAPRGGDPKKRKMSVLLNAIQ